jgi:hypothetical protein
MTSKPYELTRRPATFSKTKIILGNITISHQTSLKVTTYYTRRTWENDIRLGLGKIL